MEDMSTVKQTEEAKQIEKKYILLQSNCTIAYDDKECFLNGKVQPAIEGDTRTNQQIAEDLKKRKIL